MFFTTSLLKADQPLVEHSLVRVDNSEETDRIREMFTAFSNANVFDARSGNWGGLLPNLLRVTQAIERWG